MHSIEELIKAVYQKWKADNPVTGSTHPDENLLACYLDDKLEKQERERLQDHLVHCPACAEAVAISLKIKQKKLSVVPEALLQKIMRFMPVDQDSLLEVALRLKDRAWEIIKSNADVLLGQELIPASLLRSRQMSKLKEEVVLLKDFKLMRLEVRLNNKEESKFNVTINVKDKLTQKTKPGLRIALFQGDLEVESYATDTGSVTFENILPGKYRVDISAKGTLAGVSLDVSV